MHSLIQVFIYTALLSYAFGACCYFVGVKADRENIQKTAFILTASGFVFNLLALISRTTLSGRLPFTNGYEFLLTFVCITVLMYLVYEVRSKTQTAGGMVMLIATLLLLSIVILMPGQSAAVSPLMPALKSPWLSIHVLTATMAYSGFALAAGIAWGHLINSAQAGREEAIYRTVAAGFAMLSLSIVFGAIWAEQAWGTYWSWDPKETWALITWIIYALYLHLHKTREWKGKNASIIVISGFILVLFTFFGVNYLLSGLHSYAGISLQVWLA